MSPNDSHCWYVYIFGVVDYDGMRCCMAHRMLFWCWYCCYVWSRSNRLAGFTSNFPPNFPWKLSGSLLHSPPSIMISCLCLFVKGISLPGRNMHTSSQTWQKELGVHELKRSATSESSVLPSKPSISFQTIRVSFFSSLVVVYSTRVNATIRANKGSYTVHTRHTSEQACTL